MVTFDVQDTGKVLQVHRVRNCLISVLNFGYSSCFQIVIEKRQIGACGRNSNAATRGVSCPRVSVLENLCECGRFLGVCYIMNQLEIVHHVSGKLEVVADVDFGLFHGFLTIAYDDRREQDGASKNR